MKINRRKFFSNMLALSAVTCVKPSDVTRVTAPTVFINCVIIKNISSQLLNISYNIIAKNRNVTSINYNNSGSLMLSPLVPNNLLIIEKERLNDTQIDFLLNKELISISVTRLEILQSKNNVRPYFEYNFFDTIVNEPILIIPENIIGSIKYWNAQNLPSGLLVDQKTGIISGVISIASNYNFYVTAVGTTNLVYTKNVSLNVTTEHIGFDYTLNFVLT